VYWINIKWFEIGITRKSNNLCKAKKWKVDQNCLELLFLKLNKIWESIKFQIFQYAHYKE